MALCWSDCVIPAADIKFIAYVLKLPNCPIGLVGNADGIDGVPPPKPKFNLCVNPANIIKNHLLMPKHLQIELKHSNYYSHKSIVLALIVNQYKVAKKNNLSIYVQKPFDYKYPQSN